MQDGSQLHDTALLAAPHYLTPAHASPSAVPPAEEMRELLQKEG